jgi:hypothetical protein
MRLPSGEYQVRQHPYQRYHLNNKQWPPLLLALFVRKIGDGTYDVENSKQCQCEVKVHRSALILRRACMNRMRYHSGRRISTTGASYRGRRIATRRAGWRPFAGPVGSTSLSSTLSRIRYSRLPINPVISLFATGWQDVQDAFGSRRGPYLSCHPVILSESTIESPVLDLGFWVVERPKLSNPARGMQ